MRGLKYSPFFDCFGLWMLAVDQAALETAAMDSAQAQLKKSLKPE